MGSSSPSCTCSGKGPPCASTRTEPCASTSTGPCSASPPPPSSVGTLVTPAHAATAAGQGGYRLALRPARRGPGLHRVPTGRRQRVAELHRLRSVPRRLLRVRHPRRADRQAAADHRRARARGRQLHRAAFGDDVRRRGGQAADRRPAPGHRPRRLRRRHAAHHTRGAGASRTDPRPDAQRTPTTSDDAPTPSGSRTSPRRSPGRAASWRGRGGRLPAQAAVRHRRPSAS